jgi:hypothetical protein
MTEVDLDNIRFPLEHDETGLKTQRDFFLTVSVMEESIRLLTSSREESKPLTIVVTGCNRYVEPSITTSIRSWFL